MSLNIIDMSASEIVFIARTRWLTEGLVQVGLGIDDPIPQDRKIRCQKATVIRDALHTCALDPVCHINDIVGDEFECLGKTRAS